MLTFFYQHKPFTLLITPRITARSAPRPGRASSRPPTATMACYTKLSPTVRVLLQLSPVIQMCYICSDASYILYQFNIIKFFYQHRPFPLLIDRSSDSRSDGPYEPIHPLRDIKYWASTIYINDRQYIHINNCVYYTIDDP